MSKIAEIIESGRAPGFHGTARDPQCADVAVPRAFCQLEQQHGADKIARDSGFSVNTLKKTWDFKQKL